MDLKTANELEKTINTKLTEYDEALKHGNEFLAMNIEVEIENLLCQFNPNEIKLTTEKTIMQEIQ